NRCSCCTPFRHHGCKQGVLFFFGERVAFSPVAQKFDLLPCLDIRTGAVTADGQRQLASPLAERLQNRIVEVGAVKLIDGGTRGLACLEHFRKNETNGGSIVCCAVQSGGRCFLLEIVERGAKHVDE